MKATASRIVLRSFERPNSNLNSSSDFNVESEARRHLTGGRVNLKLAGKYPESGQSKHTLMARSSPSSALGEGRVERLKGLTELLYVRVLLSCNSINHPAQPTQWKKPLNVMRIANLNPPPFFFFDHYLQTKSAPAWIRFLTWLKTSLFFPFCRWKKGAILYRTVF